MSYKKLLIFILVISGILPVSAQIQQGYVKTKGRLGSNGAVIHGAPLDGATVTIKGGNAVVSGKNGAFSLMLPSAKFVLKSVTKKNYVLSDPDFLRKQYYYSTNDFIVVMEDELEKANERRQIEKTVRNNFYAQMEKQRKEINRLKETNKISEEKYRELLQKVNKDEDENETLIKEMVEKYSMIDFDQEDEFNRKFSVFLLNGEVTRADSLLCTKGNIKEDLNSFKAFQTANAQKRAEQAVRDSLENRSRFELADRCHKYYELFKTQHKHDSAAYYLEIRTTLDPTNVEWQNEAGDYLYDYLANYQKALLYYESALKQALLQDGETCHEVMMAYSRMGQVYLALGDYERARGSFEKSREIADEIYWDNYFQITEEVEKEMNVKSEDIKKLSMDFSQESLEILQEYKKRVDNKQCEILAYYYNHIGHMYTLVGNYDDAIDYYEDVLEIREKVLGEFHPDVAFSDVILGDIHSKIGEFPNALDYYERALKIVKEMPKENSRMMATIYNNIGCVYAEQGNFLQAINNLKEIEVINERYDYTNPYDIAKLYCNFGVLYGHLEKYSEAFDYFQKALAIYIKELGDKHPCVTDTYERMGYLYSIQGNFKKAIEYSYKGLKTNEEIYGRNNPIMNTSYKAISEIFARQGDYNNAITYYKKVIDINERQYSENSFFKGIGYNEIGELYFKQGDFDQALDYFKKTLVIVSKLFGENDSIITKTNDEKGEQMYVVKSEAYSVLVTEQKKLIISPNITTCYNNLGKVYCKMGDFAKALEFYKKALAIQNEVLGDNHSDVLKTIENIEEVKLKIKGEK